MALFFKVSKVLVLELAQVA